MKNILLFLLTVIVVPAWAEDVMSDTAAGVIIELKGSSQDISALTAKLEKETVYQDAVCSSQLARKSGKILKINCAKADSALMTFLSKNAPTKVHWSISVAAAKLNISAAPVGCATGCQMLYCPPPSGPYECCKKTSSGYQAC